MERSSPIAALLHTVLAFSDLRPEQKKAWLALIEYFAMRTESDPWGHIPRNARGILGDFDEDMRLALRENIRDLLK